MERFSGTPAGRYGAIAADQFAFTLSRPQIKLSIADHIAQMIFERIFNLRVPDGNQLGPEVMNIVCSSESRRNQIIDLIR